MSLNKIRDEVLNSGFSDILKLNAKADNSKGKWKSKAFIEELLKHGNLEKVDFTDILSKLYFRMIEHLNVEYSQSSKIRGKLRPFTPIGQKAVEEVMAGRKLEVPLERALALVNDWSCQFSCLSGYNSDSAMYKRKSIDLVWGPQNHSTGGYLIELKEWNGKDHLLFAAIEIFIYWVCFFYVRNIDLSRKNPQAAFWPAWSDFKLRVMAPEAYFKQQPSCYENLVEALNHALSAFTKEKVRTVEGYGVNSCDFSVIRLKLQKSDFIEFVNANRAVLTKKGASPLELHQSSLLRCKLK